MPQCYRCGKILMTQQSLSYHINKKNKCTKFHCDKCKISFPTQADYDIHMNDCEVQTKRHEIYDSIYSKKTVLIEVDLNGKITYISKNIEDLLKTVRNYFINKQLKEFFIDNTDYEKLMNEINKNDRGSVIYSTKTSEGETISFDADARKESDYMIISQTFIYISTSAY